jgi:regulator of sigma E protease
MAIVVAGPLANLLLAVLLFAGTYMVGVPGQRAVLAPPPPGSPAAGAGLAEGDLVAAVDGDRVRSWQDMRWRLLRASGSDGVVLTVERPDGSTSARPMSLSTVASTDWEGNFLSTLGLKIDLGPPLVNEVLPNKPAAAAGLRAGDVILAVDGRPARSPGDVAAATNAHPDEPLRFAVRRAGENLDLELTPEASEQGGRRIGLAGMRLAMDPAAIAGLSVTVRYGPAEALYQATVRTWELSVFTLKMLGRIVTGNASLKNISGPSRWPIMRVNPRKPAC